MMRSARIVSVAVILVLPRPASAQAPVTNGADAPDDVSVVGLVYPASCVAAERWSHRTWS